MLILIAGVTGLVGQACAQAALNSGHKVRGLGRNPDKLPKEIADRLEGFVTLKDVYDIHSLDTAVKGVDAIISAVHYSPVAVVDGQILLLRAAERAGVKIFHGASWNYDWTKIKLGECESYDNYLAFYNHARLSSEIKPIYGFTGGIVDYLLWHSPHSNPIDAQSKTLSFFGVGDEQLTWIVLKDLAAYTIQAISEPKAAEGGFYYVESFRSSTLELGRVYGEVHGLHLEPKSLGIVEDVDRLVHEARATIEPTRYEEYVGLAYMRLLLRGVMDFDSTDSRRWTHIKQTGLKELLEQNRDRPAGLGN
ncbi:NmrA domain-containing protein [Fusarium keratoplasticum]|nr:NmrA domain-containing protein [Fusarium keratoplasticum]